MLTKHLQLTLLIFVCLNFGYSQNMVNSSAYKLTLKALLKETVTPISVDEAKDKTAIFLDCREPQEYNVSHLKGAIYLGYENPDWNAMSNVQKDAPIIVYCSVGYRSEKIGEQLLKKGFTKVKNLYGGIFEWRNENLPIVNDKNQFTDSIHAYNKVWGMWVNNSIKVYE